jgi:hypothetical protein
MPTAMAATTNTTPVFADTLMTPFPFPVGVLDGELVGEAEVLLPVSLSAGGGASVVVAVVVVSEVVVIVAVVVVLGLLG